MVKNAGRFLLFAALSSLPFSIAAKDLADYHVGDQADEDIIAPVQMSIVDPDATEVLKQKELQQVPVVFRFYPRVADDAEAAFRAAFVATRDNFLNTVEKAYGRRALPSQELGADRFYDLVNAFLKQNKQFPLSTNRAALWASGDSDQGYQDSLAATLRDVLKHPVHPDTLPIELRSTTLIRLVPVASTDESLTLQLAERRGTSTSRGNLVPLASAKRDLQNLFVSDERAPGRYLSSFLKSNCDPDLELTGQLRAQRTEGLWAKSRYEAGQVIVKRGQVIDVKTKAALDQLKEGIAVGQLQQLLVKEQVKPAAPAGPGYWLVGSLTAVVLMLVATVWQLSRRRAPSSLLPARIGDVETQPLLPDENVSDLSWQQRALIAERRAQQAQQAIRTGLISQLARWLSDKLVRGLISQRTQLLDTQQKAAEEMAELEIRLEKIHAPLQERLQTYERRIAELEKELAVKGEENRELIKAKIEIARKQLEIERGKNRMEFN